MADDQSREFAGNRGDCVVPVDLFRRRRCLYIQICRTANFHVFFSCHDIHCIGSIQGSVGKRENDCTCNPGSISAYHAYPDSFQQGEAPNHCRNQGNDVLREEGPSLRYHDQDLILRVASSLAYRIVPIGSHTRFPIIHQILD